ncbi:hypothetical protein CRU92_01590 [Arcobacter sp. FW59]|nr:hypothetical protein CRU92_01590 [Arcobacter sp. FW59]
MNKYVISYDSLTDVLYITKEKMKANITQMDDNFIAIRKLNDKICGITVDGYKSRRMDFSWNNSLITKYFPDFDIEKLSKITTI